jgi:hypothetical protein
MHKDIFCLTQVRGDHFLGKGLDQFGFRLRILKLSEQSMKRKEVDEISGIDGPIKAINKMTTWFLPSEYTAILDIIND